MSSTFSASRKAVLSRGPRKVVACLSDALQENVNVDLGGIMQHISETRVSPVVEKVALRLGVLVGIIHRIVVHDAVVLSIVRAKVRG